MIANAVPRLELHPFRRMREAGLLATLNTDDPALTDLDLGREYSSCMEAFDYRWEDMVAIAVDGVGRPGSTRATSASSGLEREAALRSSTSLRPARRARPLQAPLAANGLSRGQGVGGDLELDLDAGGAGGQGGVEDPGEGVEHLAPGAGQGGDRCPGRGRSGRRLRPAATAPVVARVDGQLG